MADYTTYHVGGYLPQAPAQNRAMHLDGAAGTRTRWDEQGVQLDQRALTAAEASALAAQDTQQAREVNRRTLEDRLDAAETSLTTYIGLASPTAAQTTAAVKMLCRVVLGLVRLTRNRLDDVTGT